MSQIVNCKVVILGDSSTGKTSIATRYVNEKFEQIQESTIGASFLKKDVLANNCKVSYEIWDTAGQERYRSLAPMYYRNAKLALVVFDITHKNSFLSAIEWIKEIKENSENTLIALLGNKCDLENHIDKVLIEEFVKSQDIPYFETSAKQDINISEVFTILSSNFTDLNKPNNEIQPVKFKNKQNEVQNNCC